MPEVVVPGPVTEERRIREAVCVHTKKIFDSCRDKDCIEDLRFYPKLQCVDIINRAQMVTMLWRTMGQPTAGGTANFTDVPADSYYASAVAWAVENGLLQGSEAGNLMLSQPVTRQQMCTMLHRLWELIERT